MRTIKIFWLWLWGLRNLKWTELQRFVSGKHVTIGTAILIIIPLLAKLILEYDGMEISFLKKILGKITIPFNWALLYFGFVLMYASSILVRLFCPRLIFEFKNFSDFRDQGVGSDVVLGELTKYEKRNRGNQQIFQDALHVNARNYLQGRYSTLVHRANNAISNPNISVDPAGLEVIGEMLKETFSYVRELWDNEKTLINFIVLFILMLSWSIFIFIFYQNIKYVYFVMDLK